MIRHNKTWMLSAFILWMVLMGILPGCAGDGVLTGDTDLSGVIYQPPAQQKAGGLSFTLRTGWNAITYSLPAPRKFTTATMTFNGETKLLKDAAPRWTQSSIRYLKGRAWVLYPVNSTTASFQPGGKYYIYSAFNGIVLDIDRPLPSIANLSPNYGQPGAVVTMTGSNFGSSQGWSTVTFNGTAAEIASWSDTEIVCTVPVGSATGKVVVTVNGRISNGMNFTVAGTLKWSYATGDAVSSSPAIGSDGTVYVGSNDGNLYAINSDGTLKWNYPLNGVFSSPAVGFDGTIYVGTWDNYLYAINPDGTFKWSYETGNAIDSSPAIDSDETIYVAAYDGYLYAVNPDGTFKWSFMVGGAVWSSPAIGSDGTIYMGSDDSNLYAINPDGTLKWSCTLGDRMDSSPAIGSDGTIYIGSNDGNLNAINPGGTLKWSYPTGGERLESSPSIGSDGTIYIGSHNHNLYAVNSDGTLKWSYETGADIECSPAVDSDGTIYVGSDDSILYAINPDGSLKWSYPVFAYSSPAIGSDGTLYAGAEDGNLYAIYAGGTLAPSSWPMFHGNLLHTGCIPIEGPHIRQVNPSSGMPGQTITIIGMNFGESKGTVTIHGVNADSAFVTWTDTEITCIVPGCQDGGGTLYITCSDERRSNSVSFDVPQ
jgi:outer membrane protein assembly factor BamB